MENSKTKKKIRIQTLKYLAAAIFMTGLCSWGLLSSIGDWDHSSLVAKVSCFLVLPICVLGLIGLITDLVRLRRAGAPVIGEITALNSPEKSRNYTYTVKYSVNGQVYEKSFTYYDKKDNPEKMKEYLHSDIEVYYDPIKPEWARTVFPEE